MREHVKFYQISSAFSIRFINSIVEEQSFTFFPLLVTSTNSNFAKNLRTSMILEFGSLENLMISLMLCHLPS